MKKSKMLSRYARQRRQEFLKDKDNELFFTYRHDFSRVGGKEHAFVVRKDTLDIYIIKEVMGYSILNVKGHIVLDLGANIGAYSVLAMQLGADSVHGVEPEIENTEIFLANTARYTNRVTFTQAAALSAPSLDVELHQSIGPNKGAHSLYISKGSNRSPISVPAIGIESLYNLVKPTTLKLDCEGAEHDLFMNGPDIPDTVTQIIMEIHLNKREWRANAPQLIDVFKDWECIRKPVVTSKNWHTIGAWKR